MVPAFISPNNPLSCSIPNRMFNLYERSEQVLLFLYCDYNGVKWTDFKALSMKLR